MKEEARRERDPFLNAPGDDDAAWIGDNAARGRKMGGDGCSERRQPGGIALLGQAGGAAVRKLRDAGLEAGVLAMPMLPGLTDGEADLERHLAAEHDPTEDVEPARIHLLSRAIDRDPGVAEVFGGSPTSPVTNMPDAGFDSASPSIARVS